MEEVAMLYELTVLFGREMVALFLRRLTIPRMWNIFVVGNLNEKLNSMEFEEKTLDFAEEVRDRAKALLPNVDHPTKRILDKIGAGKKPNLIHYIKLDEEIIGHIIIYPMTKKCVEKFLSRKYINGNDFQNSDISSSIDDAYGYYISYLISYQKKYRSYVVLKTQSYFSHLFERNRKKNVYVMGKPSKNTLSFFARYNFINTDRSGIDKQAVHYIDKISLARSAMELYNKT